MNPLLPNISDIIRSRGRDKEAIIEALISAEAEIIRLERLCEIDRSLENVRSVALTMKEPAHMLEVCRVIAGELARLGMKEVRNVQTAIIYQVKGTYMNYEYFALRDKTVITEVRYQEQADVKAFAEKMLAGPEELFTRDFTKDELTSWIAYQERAGQFVDEHLHEVDSLHYYFYSIGTGAVGVSTYAPMDAGHVSLFKRFRNVFELAYRRYSDIEVAEKRALDAQVERERSDALLLNILPAEVANELKAKGHADAKHFDKVTILFTDFKGFTEASEKLSPQELVEELNTCFKAFDNIITERGIEKIKTIGDAYMCAGGLPVPASSTPAGVVQAALEMQAFMIARKKERDALGKAAFEMRVGIHTGPVVAGIVGVKKFAYDIWGDTVNTASRMESSGEVGQVNISEATYRLVVGSPLSVVGLGDGSRTTDNRQPTTAHAFHFTSRGKVQAKGKGEMEMYFVRRT